MNRCQTSISLESTPQEGLDSDDVVGDCVLLECGSAPLSYDPDEKALVDCGGRNKLRKRDFGVNGKISARSAPDEAIFCPGVLGEA